MMKVFACLALGVATASAASCGTFAEFAVSDSTTFTVEWQSVAEESMAVIDVVADIQGRPALQYVLTKCTDKTAAQTAYPNARVFTVPITSVTADDTVMIALLDELDVYESLVAYTNPTYITSTRVAAHIVAEAVFNYDSALGADYALLATQTADAYLINSYNWDLQASDYNNAGASSVLPGLGKGDLMFLIDESREATPLGRAEWLKVVGLLFGKEPLAATKFATISATYNTQKSFAQYVTTKPTVWSGGYSADYGGWFPPSRTSYVGKLLEDAGADYVLPAGLAVSNGLSLEAGLALAQSAKFWINPNPYPRWETLAVGVLGTRFVEMRSVQCGHVYPTDKILSASGEGSDYLERAIVRPDLVLADLMEILHPALNPGSTTTFFQRYERGNLLLSCPDDVVAVAPAASSSSSDSSSSTSTSTATPTASAAKATTDAATIGLSVGLAVAGAGAIVLVVSVFMLHRRQLAVQQSKTVQIKF